MKTYLLFNDEGHLITVIQTKVDNVYKAKLKHLLLDYGYLVEDPQDAEKQISEWKK